VKDAEGAASQTIGSSALSDGGGPGQKRIVKDQEGAGR